MDIDGFFRQTEEFLRRHFKTRAVREAEKRRLQRKTREAGRRIGRAAALAGTSGAGLACYGMMVAPLGTTALLVSGAATALASATLLAIPSWRRDRFSSAELAALPGQTEEWLLEQRLKLPGRASAELDPIFRRLADLQPQLGELDPASTLAWDARRLLGDHLPRLIQAFLDLPVSTRENDPAIRSRLTEGLKTLTEELDTLAREVSRERLVRFEAQGQFIRTRYGNEIGGK